MTTQILDRATIDAIERYGPTLGLRVPDLDGYPVAVTRTCTWTPDLTAGEAAILARLVAIARSHVDGISPAEWEALEPGIARMRTNRSRTDAQWTAMTAAQRDTALIAWCRDITDVLRALLRD